MNDRVGSEDSFLIVYCLDKYQTPRMCDETDDNTAQKTIFSFSKCFEKIVFLKIRAWIWSFLHYQEGSFFFFPKISSYTLDGKWKIIFSKNTGEYKIFFKCSEKIVFRKKSQRNMIFLAVLFWKIFIFPKSIMLFSRQKMKDDLSKKTLYGIALKYDLSCIIRKDCIFFRKYIFFFWRKMKDFSEEIHGNIILSVYVYKC